MASGVRPLTSLERERLVTRVAQSLAWSELSMLNIDAYRRRARVVVADLEAIAVHGATDKRSAERALTTVIEREATA